MIRCGFTFVPRIALVTAVLGCHPRAAGVEPPAPEAATGTSAAPVPELGGPPPEEGSYVRIPAGTRLYQGPGADAPAVVVRFGDGEGRSAEVAEVAGEWVGVWIGRSRSLPLRCTRPLSDAALGVRMWVRAGDLATVTSARIQVRFDDLTSVTLMPGVPVRATGESGPNGPFYEVDADGVRLTLALPAGQLGRSYDPTVMVTDDEPGPGPRPAVMLNDQPVRGALVVSLGPMTPTPRGTIAEATNTCVDMIVWATSEEVPAEPAIRRPGAPRFARGDRPAELRLPAGLRLVWWDGAEAGVTSGEVETEGGRFGDRYCFGVLDGETDPSLALCVPVAELPGDAAVP